ncbi:hypothetical protein CKO51_21240 [Rhodopirellula sp. SM50]|nr:hypothetical protein [Rhodopirellula sp. SM50]PAY17443.1 hypothetical protein CKO51_21240 [Rhodopirellula sp. SM50]
MDELVAHIKTGSRQKVKKPSYDWKRFWHPSNSKVHLGDRGFLSDPDTEYGNVLNPDVLTLDVCADAHFIAMLGEPGIGKSHEFRLALEAARLGASDEDLVVFFDLNGCDSGTALIEQVFRSEKVQAWEAGTGIYTLFLDSLDEGILDVPQLTTILAREIREWQALSGRFRIRIACRTRDWGQSLEQSAKDIWDDDEKIRVLDLAPLRRKDVVTAAEFHGLDGEDFLDQIRERDLEAFAMAPITLGFLLTLYGREATLPISKRDLYEEGCKHLVTELSTSRREAHRFGVHTPSQRLSVAARIASYMAFCGKSIVDTSAVPRTGGPYLSLADLAGEIEPEAADGLFVTEDAVREALDTGLFCGRGQDQFAFRHETYREYLAARHISRQPLDDSQRKSLIFHPLRSSRVVPQLREVAAWLATTSDSIRSEIVKGDPLVMLGGDSSDFDTDVRETLVQRLIEGYRVSEFDDPSWAYRFAFKKLNHPSLGGQILPIFLDRSEPEQARTLVCEIVEQCKVEQLSHAMLNSALDTSEPIDVRKAAAEAFVEIAPRPNQLLLLLKSSSHVTADLDDDLRGIALNALWPSRVISADALFTEFLTEPKRDAYGGQYANFLHGTLIKHLEKCDLPGAIEWVINHVDQMFDTHPFRYVIRDIVAKCVTALDDEEVRVGIAGLARIAVTKFHRQILSGDQLETISADARRALAEAALVPLDPFTREEKYIVQQLCLHLLRQDDTDWLINKVTLATAPDDEHRWAAILYRVYRQSDETNRDKLAELSAVNAAVADVFRGDFGFVAIKSVEADQMRAEHQAELRFRAKEGETTVRASRSTGSNRVDRIEENLALCEGGNSNRFLQILKDLRLGREMLADDGIFPDDPTTFPGWSVLSETQRERIVQAAVSFLEAWETARYRWVSGSLSYFPENFAYLALVLVTKEADADFRTLSDRVWAELAPVILCFDIPEVPGSETHSRAIRLTARLYEVAPNAVVETIKSIIDYRNRSDSRLSLTALGRIRNILDERLEQTLIDMLPRQFLFGSKGLHAGRRLSAIAQKQGMRRSRRVPCASQEPQLLADRCKRKSWHARNSDRPRQRYGSTKLVSSAINWRRPRNRPLRPWLVGQILEFLISAGRDRAVEVAHRISGLHWSNLGQACAASVALWFCSNDRGVGSLLPSLKVNKVARRRIVPTIASTFREPRGSVDSLSEETIAALFRIIVREYPYEDNDESSGARNLSDEYEVQQFRDRLLNRLCELGSSESCQQVTQLAQDFPQYEFLWGSVRRARRAHLNSSWEPMDIDALKTLLGSKNSRLVRSESELHDVIAESLSRLQSELSGEIPAARDLWDYDKRDKTWRPVNENDLSDYIARHLRRDLDALGIVSLREVQVRQRGEEGGEFTDLYVTVRIQLSRGEERQIKTIVEVKGCWNREVETAMQTQLLDRYMKNNSCFFGTYVVGWFLCGQWDPADNRYKDTRKRSTTDAREYFRQQANELTGDGFVVRSIVLDIPAFG